MAAELGVQGFLLLAHRIVTMLYDSSELKDVLPC
jgi:hypothetical protein